MPCIANTGTFARYQPFSDDRQIIVRRGAGLGHDYGLRHPDERHVAISGIDVTITSHTQTLSPPTLDPGDEPLTSDAAARYRQAYDVLWLPDAEVMIPRSPEGFTDHEVEQIISTITFR